MPPSDRNYGDHCQNHEQDLEDTLQIVNLILSKSFFVGNRKFVRSSTDPLIPSRPSFVLPVGGPAFRYYAYVFLRQRSIETSLGLFQFASTIAGPLARHWM
jgi:hypothetical protein